MAAIDFAGYLSESDNSSDDSDSPSDDEDAWPPDSEGVQPHERVTIVRYVVGDVEMELNNPGCNFVERHLVLSARLWENRMHRWTHKVDTKDAQFRVQFSEDVGVVYVDKECRIKVESREQPGHQAISKTTGCFFGLSFLNSRMQEREYCKMSERTVVMKENREEEENLFAQLDGAGSFRAFRNYLRIVQLARRLKVHNPGHKLQVWVGRTRTLP